MCIYRATGRRRPYISISELASERSGRARQEGSCVTGQCGLACCLCVIHANLQSGQWLGARCVRVVCVDAQNIIVADSVNNCSLWCAMHRANAQNVYTALYCAPSCVVTAWLSLSVTWSSGVGPASDGYREHLLLRWAACFGGYMTDLLMMMTSRSRNDNEVTPCNDDRRTTNDTVTVVASNINDDVSSVSLAEQRVCITYELTTVWTWTCTLA